MAERESSGYCMYYPPKVLIQNNNTTCSRPYVNSDDYCNFYHTTYKIKSEGKRICGDCKYFKVNE